MKYSHANRVDELFRAAEYNDPAMVKIIMEEGMDPNIRHEGGGTPFHFAITSGNFEIAEMLLGYGADINALATKDGNDHGMGSCGTALHWVCTNNSKSEAVWLIKQGISLDKAGNDGETALHEAIKHGHNELAETLLQHGAKANQPDAIGALPLHLAAKVGNAEGINLLLSYGSGINTADKYGETALHYACHYCANEEHLQAAITLIEAGTDLTKPNDEGILALDKFSATPIRQWLTSKNLKKELEQSILETPATKHNTRRKTLSL